MSRQHYIVQQNIAHPLHYGMDYMISTNVVECFVFHFYFRLLAVAATFPCEIVCAIRSNEASVQFFIFSGCFCCCFVRFLHNIARAHIQINWLRWRERENTTSQQHSGIFCIILFRTEIMVRAFPFSQQMFGNINVAKSFDT